jgi:MFS family permease
LCAIAAAIVLTFLNVPRPNVSHSLADGRPLSAIVVQPKFLVAVVCGLASYTMMNMVMTSAPLAMVMCNHTVSEAALGIQWHVVGMYAPSFITGSLIARFGVRRMMAIGLALMVVAASIELEGIAIWNFWVGLTILGVGWNFAFISATTLVTECHDPHERNKVQAFNDFLVFGSMALGSFASGALLAHYGWTAVNDMVFPVIFVAAALLVWGSLARRPKAA